MGDDDDKIVEQHVEKLGEQAKEPKKNLSEPWWTDARKIFVGQILTLMLTPASVAVTFFLTEHYKAPNPKIEYISVGKRVFQYESSGSVAQQIKNEPRLAAAFRELLPRASLSLKDPQMCVAWLDGGDWERDCEDAYRNVTNQLKEMAEAAGQQLASGRKTTNTIPFLNESLSSAKRAYRILEPFAKELNEQRTVVRPRSGSAELTVGIMNNGASDGTINREAVIRFSGQIVKVYTDHYLPIKAHGFEEVTFVTARENEGKYFGEWDPEQEKAIKIWSDLLKRGEEVSLELTVKVGDKTDSIKSTVPKESK